MNLCTFSAVGLVFSNLLNYYLSFLAFLSRPLFFCMMEDILRHTPDITPNISLIIIHYPIVNHSLFFDFSVAAFRYWMKSGPRKFFHT